MSLNREEIRLLDVIEQDYLLSRSIPSQDVCHEHYGFKRIDYTNAFKKQDFRDALEQRGVPLPAFVGNKVASAGLTPKQLMTINIILDSTDNRSIKKKLNDCNVSTQQWEAWLRDPAVQSYLTTRTEGALTDNQFHAHLALIDRVKEGDLASIKYFNAVTGFFVENRQDSIDVHFLLTRILEIVMKYVDDPVKLEAMSTELSALGTATKVGAAITAPEMPKALVL